MHAKNLIINYDRQRQKIKHVRKYPPNVGSMVFPYTLGIKSVTLRHSPRLMIPSH